MSTLTYTNSLQNGTTADADEVMANFNNITSVVNGSIDGTNIDTSTALSVASIVNAGILTQTGVATFTATPKMDAIAEKTGATGVTIDGILLKDSLDGSSIVALTGAQTIAGAKTYDEGAVIHAPKTYTPAGAATATLDLALGNNHEITIQLKLTIILSSEK